MLWIVGGRELALAIAASAGWFGLHETLSHQLEHADWHGFTAWDLIFPLFLFLAGVSMPFSFSKRREQGQSPVLLVAHSVWRGLALVLLGMVYNGLLAFDFDSLRIASVLGRIGLAGMFASWVVLAVGPRRQLGIALGILLVYSIALLTVPVPGVGAGEFSRGHSLGDWVDQQLLPGRLHRGNHDPEGLLSTIPAIATALFGALAGSWLMRAGRTTRASAGLLLAGLAAFVLAFVAQQWIPVNKRLWTPSFVLWAAGVSACLLAVAHQCFDVFGWRRLAFPFVVLGSNAIALYLLHRFVDFEALARLSFGKALANDVLHPIAVEAGALLFAWGVVYLLWRARIFLRV